MPAITIKDIPEDLLERLRHRAARDKRSMNKEVVHLLDLALSGEMAAADAATLARRIEKQVQAWTQLAGRWESDLETADEIARRIEPVAAARAAVPRKWGWNPREFYDGCRISNIAEDETVGALRRVDDIV